MADATVHLTTFVEGVLVHGQAEPQVLLVPCQHSPHRGILMPPQAPWAPGFLPQALLQAQINEGWKIPYRVVDSSKLPVVFDERTSRLPTPWCLRLEGLEGQQRVYLTYLLRTRSTEEGAPPPPPGGRWVDEKSLEGLDLLASVKRICQAAIAAVRQG